ncbi:unnamed protein product [Thelazia callipaeda]|uniref:Uncharacterized protein n=1 Tax=Thelazia callipaeda TaxID=103827 RepID=A0A0N5CS03_THECL|nr:unnamed protein product [Thelazia callipaeda]
MPAHLAIQVSLQSGLHIEIESAALAILCNPMPSSTMPSRAWRCSPPYPIPYLTRPNSFGGSVLNNY